MSESYSLVFTHNEELREVEEQLYGHIRAAIDWDMVYRLEETLASLLSIERKIESTLAFDLAAAIIERALHRAAEDPTRYGDCGPPDGVTEEEKAAVAFD